MAEMKRNFSKAIMNKDVDERLVPPGQYRDALNIQISTSDGSNVGSAQTLMGNTKHNTMLPEDGVYAVPDTATCVASIAAPDKDKIYYFVSGGDKNNASGFTAIRKDYIVEYDTVLQKHRYVFVDIYRVTTTTEHATSSQQYITVDIGGTTRNITGIRIGMVVTGTIDGITYDTSDGLRVSDIKYSASGTTWQIFLEHPDGTAFSDDCAEDVAVEFHADRVLNFSKGNIITGINVLDDFIYWTDNTTEPKKISISRSIAGTGGTEYLTNAGGGSPIGGISSVNTTDVHVIFEGDTDTFHTRLVKDKSTYDTEANRFEVVTNAAKNKAIWVDESHVTVIKKAPTQPLELDMFRGPSSRITTAGVENSLYASVFLDVAPESSGDLAATGDELDATFNDNVDYRVGDIIILAVQEWTDSSTDFEEHQIRARVTASPVTDPNSLSAGPFTIEILSISSSLSELETANPIPFYARLETGESIFEHKFPRFSYRYKYQDGEYSTFAPWSRIAFLPDYYDFQGKKGYNLGMVNQVKSIKLKQYHAQENAIPQDVVEIDLLYKETNNPTVYTVKTVKRADGFDGGVWPDLVADSAARGEFVLDTDMIYAVVPSNQLLRPWDNVPRRALAQEISANRLIYGNYVQNYTVLKDPIIDVGVHADGLYYASLNVSNGTYALPSVKTLRDYQVGVVFSDGYGRETPVLTSKKASINIPKSISHRRNRLQVGLSQETVIPSWAKYFSWYVKETSAGYHTMSMDRWYNAETDDNIWLSFPSSERNKVDIDTFLVLKKAHGTSVVVTEPARYKVLAIESEAPEVIKTKKKSLGRLAAGDGGGSVGGSNGGYPLQDTTYITITSGAFNNAFGDQVHIKTPDKLMVRFSGQGLMSKDYEVVRISLASELYTLKIDGKFGPDAAFVSTNDTYGGAIDDLVVELREFEAQNSPEFDGRFFVKVHKDAVLSKHVLTQTTTDYIVDDSWKLGYINNNGWKNEDSPMFEGLKHHHPDTAVTNRKNHPTRYAHHADSEWANYTNIGGTDEIGGISAAEINTAPVEEINGSGGHEFWSEMSKKEMFFIDACTAYSWAGKDDHRPGNYWWSTSGTSGYNSDQDFFDSGGMASNKPEGAPGGVTGSMSPSFRAGQASRGIWNNGNFMDISWTGMGLGYDGGDWSDNTDGENFYPHRLKDFAAGTVHADANVFIKKLVTPGTRFRFQKDPDSVVYTVDNNYATSNIGYNNTDWWEANTNIHDGAWGIRNFRTANIIASTADKMQYAGHNLRQRWTISFTPAIGSGDSGYNPIKGTISGADTDVVPIRHDGYSTMNEAIEIVLPFFDEKDSYSENPAIWETEPKDSPDLDIYYQASGLTPLELNEKTNEEYIPIGSTFKLHSGNASDPTFHTVTGWSAPQTLTFTPAIATGLNTISNGQTLTFNKRDHYTIRAVANGAVGTGGTSITLWGGPNTAASSKKLYSQTHSLDWSNCWSFGNGVESDAVRDSFNSAKLDNGVKASTVLAVQSREERRKHGLIWSGIYNSNSGVNDTNQFIAAEKITKDVNPSHGSIQRLLNRDTRLIMFCEDKILRGVTNKDALYNADGNPQLVASNAVVGDVTAYQGDYGISTNPESLAVTPYNAYFTDIIRGHVLALSSEGVRSISNIGMRDYFADISAAYVWQSLGTYDERKSEYNVTISKKYANYQIQPHEQTTISYSEVAKGWVSLKSFYPQHGVSLNNNYYTFYNGHIWKHHVNERRNNFYETQYTSDVTLIFNDAVEAVKSFGAINYEGSQAKVTNFDTEDAHTTGTTTDNWLTGNYSTNAGIEAGKTVTDGEYYNLETTVAGWYVDNVVTNLQTCGNIEFRDKEGKWYGVISGETTGLSNLDEKEFSVQGIGLADLAISGSTPGPVTLTIENNTSTTYATDGGGGSAWDSTAD
jgi:hypothetical protein